MPARLRQQRSTVLQQNSVTAGLIDGQTTRRGENRLQSRLCTTQSELRLSRSPLRRCSDRRAWTRGSSVALSSPRASDLASRRWRSGDIARSRSDTMNHVLFTIHAGLPITPSADANDQGACVANRTFFSTSERSCAKSCRIPLRVSVKPNSSWTSSSATGVAYLGWA